VSRALGDGQSMRVLMFGWEFPPRVSGGLGVACEGLVRGLLELDTEVTLVLPFSVASAPGNSRGFRIVAAPTLGETETASSRPPRVRLRRRRVRSLLRPYQTAELYV
jgi:hypothetical protein